MLACFIKEEYLIGYSVGYLYKLSLPNNFIFQYVLNLLYPTK